MGNWDDVQYDDLKSRILKVEVELSKLALPYAHLIGKLKEIPGVSETLAIGILAESGDNMSHFADERKYAAWAGVAAGNNESAKKKKEQNAEREILI